MKILALGGSGNMGRMAINTILESKMVDQLIVADNDIERSNDFVKTADDNRVSATALDVTDNSALEQLISQSDIVMNTIGPFYRFGATIIRAAIKTGRHYIDIMDDYGPTREALDLNEDAHRAGIIVLIGMGASPGLTNIMARHGVNQLDTTEYIQTVWGSVGGIRRARSEINFRAPSDRPRRRIPAANIHDIYSTSDKIPIFRDGESIEIIPLETGEEVTFPNGKGFFYYYGHGEPITLPHFIEGLQGACNLVGLGPESREAHMELGARVRAGEITPDEAAAMEGQEILKKLQQRPDEALDMGPRVGGLHASVTGTRDGKRLRLGYGCTGAPSGGMAGVTSIPMAIGTEMIMNGEISQRGVLAPEACIDPMPFFKRYMKYWRNPPDSVEQALYEVVEEL